MTAELPFHEPFRISLSESSGTTNLFVRITTEDGVVGLGEASPSPSITGDTARGMATAGRILAADILGREALDLEGAAAWMAGSVEGQTTIRSAFDMALHDIAARVANLPLHAFLGGPGKPFETDNTVGMDNPDVMAAKAAAFVADGFRAVKAKVGTGEEEDVARIRAIRTAVGPDVPIRIDANQGWDVSTSISVLSQVASLGIEYCEQPVLRGDTAGLAAVRAESEIPVMADESVFDDADALELVGAHACDYLNIKLSKSAGLRTALRIAAIAEAASTPCMVGCMSETRVGLTAAAHLIASRSIIAFADLDSHVDHTVDPVVGGMTIHNGMVHLPDGPGIGAHLDPDFVATCTLERFGA